MNRTSHAASGVCNMYNVYQQPSQFGMGNGPQAMQGGMNGPNAMGSPMNGQQAMEMPQMGAMNPAAGPMPQGGMNPMAMMAMQGGQQMMQGGGGQDAAAQEMMRRQQMSQQGIDRMQQIAAMMRQRQGYA